MKKFNFLARLGVVAGILTPMAVFAQTVADQCASVGAGTLNFIICRAAVLINTIIPILITLGVVYFIYGVITYVIAKDEDAKSRGRNVMIWGLIGLLVIVSIWGLVAILKNTFGVTNSSSIQVPCIESPGVDCP